MFDSLRCLISDYKLIRLQKLSDYPGPFFYQFGPTGTVGLRTLGLAEWVGLGLFSH